MAKDTKRVVDETIGAFKALKKEIAEYKDQLASLKVGTEEWNKAAEKLRNAQKQVDAINKAAKGTLVDYNNAQANSINALKEKIKLLNQERNAMDMNSQEYEEATRQLKILNDQLREAGTSAGDWKANVGNYTQSIKDAFGELGTAATGLGGNLGGLNASMLKLASNPLGAAVLALVSAIKFLAEGIKSSEENTKRWNEVMVPVKALLVTIQQYAQAAAEKFLDFAENLKMSEGAGKAIQVVLQALVTMFNQTVTRLKNMGEAISSIWDGIKGFIDDVKTWAKGLEETFEPVINFVDRLKDKIKESLEPVIDWIIDKYNWLAKSDLGKRLGLESIDQIKKDWNDAGKSVKEVTDKVNQNIDAVKRLTKAENDLSASKRGLLQQQAALEKEIAGYERQYQEAREEKDWVTAQDALNKKKEKEIELAKTNIALAQAEYNIIKQKNSLADSNSKDLEAEAQALANVTRAQAAYEAALAGAAKEQKAFNKEVEAFNKQQSAEAYKNHLAELNTEINKLTANYNAAIATLQTPLKPEGGEIDSSSLDAYYDQINANAQAEYDAYVALQQAKMEELQKFIDAELAAGRDASKEKVELAKLREEETLGYAAQYKKMNDTITKSNKDRAKMQLALQRSELKGYADLMDSVSGLFEENTVAYKATATAKALINTYLAATSALAETPGGAIAKGVAMAATLAAGLAQVISIWKVNPSGENSVPSSNTSTPSVAEPVVEQTNPYSYTRSVQTFEEEDKLNQPMFVSVVDINNVQNRVRVTEQESTF